MLLIIDNYDSFTYNLVQYFGELGAEPVVKRNDEIGIAEIEALSAALAGITAPIPPRFPSIHWLSGYRFGLGLRATPDPQ